MPSNGQFRFFPADYLLSRGPDGRRCLPHRGEVNFLNGPSADSTPHTHESVIGANRSVNVSPASEFVVPVLHLTVSTTSDCSAFDIARLISAPVSARATWHENKDTGDERRGQRGRFSHQRRAALAWIRGG